MRRTPAAASTSKSAIMLSMTSPTSTVSWRAWGASVEACWLAAWKSARIRSVRSGACVVAQMRATSTLVDRSASVNAAFTYSILDVVLVLLSRAINSRRSRVYGFRSVSALRMQATWPP